MTRTRIALLGAGAWGLNHVRMLASEPRCELVAVVDPDPRACAQARELAPETRTLGAADAVIADPAIDALVIATPAPTHAALACAALDAGKHVLVEKPVALSLADVQLLAERADATGLVALAGHLMVFHPAVVRLRELLRSDELGAPRCVYSIRANQGRIRRDESALWTFGPHELSMLDFVLDETPVSVSAHGTSVMDSGLEDVVFLTLRYASGITAHVHVSRVHPRKERRFTLIGTRKLVELDDVAGEKLRILTPADGNVSIPTLSIAEPLRLQLTHFLDCIRGTEQARPDMASALRIVAALDAAERSLRQGGRPMDLAPIARGGWYNARARRQDAP